MWPFWLLKIDTWKPVFMFVFIPLSLVFFLEICLHLETICFVFVFKKRKRNLNNVLFWFVVEKMSWGSNKIYSFFVANDWLLEWGKNRKGDYHQPFERGKMAPYIRLKSQDSLSKKIKVQIFTTWSPKQRIATIQIWPQKNTTKTYSIGKKFRYKSR